MPLDFFPCIQSHVIQGLFQQPVAHTHPPTTCSPLVTTFCAVRHRGCWPQCLMLMLVDCTCDHSTVARQCLPIGCSQHAVRLRTQSFDRPRFKGGLHSRYRCWPTTGCVQLVGEQGSLTTSCSTLHTCQQCSKAGLRGVCKWLC